ncbi:TlpA family protein disulfide reductase [bacterium]|nr:TlpA family protein disulfide reductase [bacterium]
MKKIRSFPIVLGLGILLIVQGIGAVDDKVKKAPEFSLEILDGKTVSLSNYEGKVLFLNFWATWCPPCRDEIPGFIEMYEEYQAEGLEIIGISLDKGNRNKVKQFVKSYEINYPVAMATPKVVEDYQPGRYIPTTIVIDREGKIRHKHVGYMDKETMKKYFLELSKK